MILLVSIEFNKELDRAYSFSTYWCRTEQLLAAQGASPETMGSNGHELALFGHALDAQHPHLSGASNNLVRLVTSSRRCAGRDHCPTKCRHNADILFGFES